MAIANHPIPRESSAAPTGVVRETHFDFVRDKETCETNDPRFERQKRRGVLTICYRQRIQVSCVWLSCLVQLVWGDLCEGVVITANGGVWGALTALTA